MDSPLIAVAVVFALLGALLFWTRRVAAGSTPELSLRVVDAVNLGSGRSVAVLRSGERYFLLGATPHSISLLAELAPGDVAASRQAAAPPAGWGGLPQVAARIRAMRNR